MLLSYLILNPEEEMGVSSESVQTFIETLRSDFPLERVPVVLAPLLYKEKKDITEDRQVTERSSGRQHFFMLSLSQKWCTMLHIAPTRIACA